MPKTYYVFLAIVFILSLAIGFVARGFFSCNSEQEEILSLKDVKGESKAKINTNRENCELFVDVSGAVMNPGVVCLQGGAIVNDAIIKADGFNPSAYAFKYVAQRINLARILENEEKIYIPFRDDVVCRLVEDEQVKYVDSVMKGIQASESIKDVTEKVATQKETESDCININSASKEKIMELSGIGEAKATDIIAGRPYSKLEDLKEVKGIGDKTFENIEPFICL